eukprot:214628-Heterocapsa_arctica.AAC.1
MGFDGWWHCTKCEGRGPGLNNKFCTAYCITKARSILVCQNRWCFRIERSISRGWSPSKAV